MLINFWPLLCCWWDEREWKMRVSISWHSSELFFVWCLCAQKVVWNCQSNNQVRNWSCHWAVRGKLWGTSTCTIDLRAVLLFWTMWIEGIPGVSQCSTFQKLQIPLAMMGADQCELFTLEGILKVSWKLSHLVCMFAWRWKGFTTVSFLVTCGCTHYEMLCLKAVLLVVGQVCCSLASTEHVTRCGLAVSMERLYIRSQRGQIALFGDFWTRSLLFADNGVLVSSLKP